MNSENPNYYAIIPAEVRYDKELKDKAKLLYGEITALAQKDGRCYATNRYFAQLYGVSITTVSKLVKNLVDKGYINSEIEYREGTKEILNRYLTLVQEGSLKKVQYPIEEKLKENNTSMKRIQDMNIKETIKESFDNFWNSYPKKMGKQNCLKWFEKNKPSLEKMNLILEKLELFKKTKQWNQSNGKYIPYPATWLNQKRWEDEITESDLIVTEDDNLDELRRMYEEQMKGE